MAHGESAPSLDRSCAMLLPYRKSPAHVILLPVTPGNERVVWSARRSPHGVVA